MLTQYFIQFIRPMPIPWTGWHLLSWCDWRLRFIPCSNRADIDGYCKGHCSLYAHRSRSQTAVCARMRHSRWRNDEHVVEVPPRSGTRTLHCSDAPHRDFTIFSLLFARVILTCTNRFGLRRLPFLLIGCDRGHVMVGHRYLTVACYAGVFISIIFQMCIAHNDS